MEEKTRDFLHPPYININEGKMALTANRKQLKTS